MIVGSIDTRTLLTVGKRKNFGVATEIGITEIILHPLPVYLQHSKDLCVGDLVTGRYGQVHDTQKRDVQGKKIFVQYFIPLESVQQEKILDRCETT